jgi:RNA polymerase sigma-70 factor (ECF subfamily)
VTPDPPTGDNELLTRHVAGDRTAFAELVERHRDRLWAVALRTLGDPDDAADAVQDALVSAYRRAGGFRGEAAVTTWLHRIVVNACLDLARRRAARPTQALADADLLPDRHDPVVARETALTVLSALRQLPVDQAAAVVLVDVEGFPVAEAATILDVPVGTVKSRCARARARLAVLLGEIEAGDVARNDPSSPAVQPPASPYDEERA